MNSKIIVVGYGGREYSIIKSLKRDTKVLNLERKISKALSLKTQINLGKKENSIVIKFNNMDELDYLIAMLCENSKLTI